MTLRFCPFLIAFTILCTGTACAPPEPVRIGFLGSLSGRGADLGIGGRNGATLAVELKNKAGGIRGRPIELIAENDQQDGETGKLALQRLRERKVEAIVGPMTSGVSMSILPAVNTSKIPVVSPTATSNQLTGLDDYFFRVIGPTRNYAQDLAAYHSGIVKILHISAAIDDSNLAYAESWLNDYQAALSAAGGEVISVIRFRSGENTPFAKIADQLLAHAPQGIMIIGNSVDTASIAHMIRKKDPSIPLSAPEWAATERLIELGGKAVEGMSLAQFFDRSSSLPAYQAFRQVFIERFSQEPGFAGVTSFDATNVVIDALERREAGQELKQAILARKEYPGVQGGFPMDDFGDSMRKTFVTVIRDGKFEVVK